MAFLQVQHNEKALLLNTPNRNELLKAGPPHNSTCAVLGRGSYGTVFAGVFQSQQVAVKVVRNMKDINVQSMRNEAHILGWRHRNITQIFKVESTPSFGLIIMERFEGQSLQAILDAIALPLTHRVVITLDVLAALSYCAKKSLLHLDVKPQNILLSFAVSHCKYVCKLCDFGSSLKLTEPQEALRSNGAARGTVRYMSPEALRQSTLTCAADIYSLGVTMWQLQHRQLPYHWLECNDMVAYQVVKHDLRPDAAEGTVQSDPSDRSVDAKCFCDIIPRCGAIAEKITRRAFFDVTQRLKAVRDLGADFNTKSPKRDDDQSTLRSIFRETAAEPNVNKEATYESIYKSCWHRELRKRPKSQQLQRQLKRLL